MFNQITLCGRLVKPPELRFTANTGTAVCSFTLAVDRGDKDKTTDFFDCIAWQKTGELVAQYLDKGSKCLVVGKMTFRKWENKDGQKRSTPEVIVDRVVFLDSKKDGQAEQAKAVFGAKEIDENSEVPF